MQAGGKIIFAHPICHVLTGGHDKRSCGCSAELDTLPLEKNGEALNKMSKPAATCHLTPEEDFLWNCARQWRAPSMPACTAQLDWQRLIEMSRWNRMQILLHRVLAGTGLLDDLPAGAMALLREDIDRYTENAEILGRGLRRYLSLAGQRGVETVVLKGLSVSIKIYGDPSIRPGGDVDLLVRKDQVDACVAVLEEMGLGRYWPHLMDDAYYGRHHLHQQRCSKDTKIWFEAHWALDHPYTLLTIDYEALMDRTTPGELLGGSVRDLAPPDLLLSLAAHLVKHAVYLPSAVDRPDLRRIILADGMLMYFVDVAEAVKRYDDEIDWPFLIALAQASGATTILGSVLRICRDHLEAAVPGFVVDELPIRAPKGLTARMMKRLIDYQVATHQGQDRSRFWDFMLMTDESFILRPIRALDTAAYFVPGSDFLERRYGGASWAHAAGHVARATEQYARLGVDTAYYSWRRNRRRKSLAQSAPAADVPSGDPLAGSD